MVTKICSDIKNFSLVGLEQWFDVVSVVGFVLLWGFYILGAKRYQKLRKHTEYILVRLFKRFRNGSNFVQSIHIKFRSGKVARTY